MGKQKENRILFILLPVILLVCYGIWSLRVDAGSEVLIYSDTPEWDLRAFDFDGGQFVRARGYTAEYVPEALLTLEEFETADYTVGQPKNAAEYLTSRFRLFVPDGRVYALMTHSVDYADRIYIGGQLYQEIGRPAASREAMVPQTLTQYYTVVPENGVIEIVQQVSNFVHREGGNPTGFRIGSIETAGRHYNRTVSMAALTMGCFLLLFVLHMALYLMQPGYLANLYFSLFYLAMMLLVSVSGARVITALFPRVSWALTFRVGYMSIALGVLLCTLALDAMFEGLLQRPVKWAVAVLLGAGTAVFAVADTVLMSWLSLAASPLYGLVALYVAARLFGRLRSKDRRGVELTIVLCGVAVMAYALLRDTLLHNDITIFPRVSADLTDFAVLVFVLLQMTAAFHGTMREAAAAKEREQRTAAEKAVLEALARRKSAFYTDISHELKTPLTVIDATAQFAAKQIAAGRVDAETIVDLGAISSEAKRLAKMVTGLVAMSRLQDGGVRHAPLALDAVVGDTARMYASLLEKHGNTLSVTIEPGLPQVTGNADQLSQILINLLSNANRHTRDGHITVDARAEDSLVRVTVADTGDGIPPALLPSVFERFSHGGGDGAGLGLPISRTIAQAHGGEMGIESEAGKGTAVWFTLPRNGGNGHG